VPKFYLSITNPTNPIIPNTTRVKGHRRPAIAHSTYIADVEVIVVFPNATIPKPIKEENTTHKTKTPKATRM
jgi:hypothetical protein